MPTGIYDRKMSKTNAGIFKKGHQQGMSGKRHLEETKTKMSKKRKAYLKANPQMGEKAPRWKGGRWISSDGYVMIYKPNHPFCDSDRYVREHRLVMEKYLDRYLTLEERVHHRGIKYPLNSVENKQDNRIENLKLFANESEHSYYHGKIDYPKGSMFGANSKNI